jgi:hypothetical protein
VARVRYSERETIDTVVTPFGSMRGVRIVIDRPVQVSWQDIREQTQLVWKRRSGQDSVIDAYLIPVAGLDPVRARGGQIAPLATKADAERWLAATERAFIDSMSANDLSRGFLIACSQVGRARRGAGCLAIAQDYDLRIASPSRRETDARYPFRVGRRSWAVSGVIGFGLIAGFVKYSVR